MTDTKPIIHQPNRPVIHRRDYIRDRGYYNTSWWGGGSWWPWPLWGYGYRNRGRGPYGSTGNHGHDYMGEAPYRHTHEHGHPANDIDDYYDDPDGGLWLCFVFWFVLILILLFLPLIFWGGYGHHGHHHASDDEFTNAVCEALPDCVAFQDLLDRVALLEAAAP